MKKLYFYTFVLIVIESTWKNCNVSCVKPFSCLHNIGNRSINKPIICWLLLFYCIFNIFLFLISILLAKYYVLWYLVDIWVSFFLLIMLLKINRLFKLIIKITLICVKYKYIVTCDKEICSNLLVLWRQERTNE